MTEQTTRDQILDAALQLLREGGPEKLTQTRVARAAGVSQGHLTYYFPRKADLWRAVTERACASFAGRLEGARSSTSPAERRAFLQRIATEIVTGRDDLVVFLGLCLQVRVDDEVRRIMLEALRGFRGALATLDPERADVDILMATVWGLAIRHYLSQGAEDEAETAGLLERVLSG